MCGRQYWLVRLVHAILTSELPSDDTVLCLIVANYRGGLLVLTGARAALQGTPGEILAGIICSDILKTLAAKHFVCAFYN